MRIEVITYITSTGKDPFTEWLEDLEADARLIIKARVARVMVGNFGDCKLLKDGSGIWELRIDYGPGYRVYFGKKGTVIVILLLGGDKSDQNRDIAKAKRYWQSCKG